MRGRPESEKAYYGSFFLMEAALEGPLARYAEGVFSRTGHGPYEVIISQVVVGETHAVLIRRHRDRARRMGVIGRLHDAFADTGEGANMCKRNGLRPIDPKKIAGIVVDLVKRVPELDGTDLIILAIALADPDSAYLLTRDHVLVRSEKIMAYEEELRNADMRNVRLRITDTL